MASIKKFINKSPNIIKKLYYKLVPFYKRYGSEFKDTYDFLLHSIDFTPKQLKEYQFFKLRETISNAYQNVPYYHKLMVDYGIPRYIHDPSDISKLPILTKQLVKDNWKDLINKKYKGDIITFKTSGSTGEKFKFLGNDNLYKREAAFVLRAFNMHNASLYDKPSVWIRRYAPKAGDPISYTDHELNRVYLSPFNLSPSTIESYVAEIDRTSAETLVTYPSLANFMANLMYDKCLRFKKIKSIHVASEMILPEWRNNVRAKLGINLYAHYGMMEKVSFFSNFLGSDKYAESLEYGFTEIVNGDVIGTGFLNDVMPFIRYSPGDRAVKNSDIEYFNALPVSVNDFIGRSTDMIFTKDGRKLSGVNFYTMMYKIPGVEMFQITQKSINEIIVDYIPSDKWGKDTENCIIDGMEDRVGKDIKLKINSVIELERSSTGKFKTIKNEC